LSPGSIKKKVEVRTGKSEAKLEKIREQNLHSNFAEIQARRDKNGVLGRLKLKFYTIHKIFPATFAL